ncbi:MAG: hypothetical protein ACR2F8_05495, partial [Caulobacteraceae bacterium]
GLYSGRFPVAVTEAGNDNFTGCLVLTDNGQGGFPHSGPAVLDASQTFGQFQVIGRFLLVTIGHASDNAELTYVEFAAPAKSGIFGVGVYDNNGIFTNTGFEVGKATFGNRGGC